MQHLVALKLAFRPQEKIAREGGGATVSVIDAGKTQSAKGFQ